MEFLGLEAMAFDFFKNKDKYSKEDYNKYRDEMKLQFRSFCYEIQKLYHKKTDGFFELERDFQKLSKKSENIRAEHNVDKGGKVVIQLNSEELAVFFETEDKGLILNKKSHLQEYIYSNKKSFIALTQSGKNKNNEIMRVGCLDFNEKMYNLLTQKLDASTLLLIGVSFNKQTCIKQQKQLVQSVYDELMKIVCFTKDL
ncbi:MAG: hypothetical protein N2594_01835 [Clostridiales bacterium]|nr:hypothetical protein [Clostridiales bacterium]